MKDRKKLVYTAYGNQSLLFDLDKDPMERHDLSDDESYRECKEELWNLLLAHTARYTPEALDENGRFLVCPAPRFPGDMPGRWFGFHYHDYNVDTFH